MNAQTVVLIFIFILNCLAMFIFYTVLRSRFSQKRILSELRSEVDKLVVDLGREADRDVAILESRIKNLRSLIDEADRRILVASKETVRRKEETDIIENMGRSARDSNGSAPVTVRSDAPAKAYARQSLPTAEVPSQMTDTQQSVIKNQQPLSRDDSRTSRPSQEPVQIYTRPVIKRSEKQVEPYVPVQERVIDMARKGFSAELISGTLSMPLGEVELILDMNSSSL